MIPVPGYPKYVAYRDGRILSLRTGRVMRPRLSGKGYRQVTLWNAAGHRSFYVHHIIAGIFIGERPPKMETNHKNGDKTDNSVENLEYVTSSQNKEHARDTLGLNRGSNALHSKISERQAREIRRLAAQRVGYPSIARRFGVTRSTVCDIHRRRTWKHVDLEAEFIAQGAERREEP